MRCPPLPLVDAAADLDAVRANDGVPLFLARAEAATGSFTLDGAAASAIAEICARLDGLPLAIELAAARVAVLPPPVLLRRLDQRLPLLTGGAHDVDPRQRTLRAAIEWSYELLDVGQRKLFERLSVFVDGCRFEAVEAVCDHERDVGLDLLDGLQDLVDKSLLRQRPDPDGDPRFWLLETIREYGLERLREHGQFDAVAQAHADHYPAVAERSRDSREQETLWMRALEADHENLRAANSWFHSVGQREAELRLVSALAGFWDLRGHYGEAWTRIRAALEASQAEATIVRARALAAASDFARIAGHVDLARQFCEECLAISRQIGDQPGVARALHELGEAALEQEAYADATALFEEAIEVGRAAGLPAAGSTGNLGWVALLQGDPQRADNLFQQSLELFRARGHLSGILVGLSNLAETKLALLQPELARDYLLEGLRLAQEAEAAGDVANEMLETAAALLLEVGAPEEAARLTGASDALFEANPFSMHPAEQRRRHEIRATIDARLGAAAEQLRHEGREAAGRAIDLAVEALADTASGVR